jgi:very-short-patch-repair endonuclease
MDDATMRLRAAQQHGLVGWYQLAYMGCSEEELRHRLRTGSIERLSRSVFRLAGSPATLDQRRMAAVLDGGIGSAISHDSAAAAWGVGRDSRSQLQVVRERRGSAPRVSLATVHEARDIRQHHLVLRRGVPTTTPARTVLDLAATAHPDRVERILDAAWSRRLLNIGELANVLFEVRGRGRGGSRLVDQLVANRWNQPRPGSALEMHFVCGLERYGLPAMRRQVHLSDDEGWIGCVDFVAVDVPVVLFIDGAAWHTSLTDRRHDDRQTTRIKALGYHVERVSDLQVLYEERPLMHRLRPLLLACSSGVPTPELQARTGEEGGEEGGAEGGEAA